MGTIRLKTSLVIAKLYLTTQLSTSSKMISTQFLLANTNHFTLRTVLSLIINCPIMKYNTRFHFE